MPRSEIYAFADFTLDVPQRRLRRRDEAIALPPKAFDLLVALLRGGDRLRTKEDLLSTVWPSAEVEEGILTVHVSALRKALGDSSRAPRFIETVAKSGYRFVADVQAPQQRASERPRASVAVLPFASTDAADQYFSDGLSEQIINALARVDGLKVTGRTSSFGVRGASLDLTRIAALLNVRTILEGSVRRSERRIRVTAHLIEAENGFQLWSQTFDRDAAGVFAVRDEIARAIAAALKLELSASTGPAPQEPPSLRAYEAYLRGMHELRLVTAPSLLRAREHFERAVALAPEYAAPHTGLAICNVSLATESIRPAHEVMPLARAAASKSLELDPTDTDALAMLGQVARTYDYDRREAERVERAIGDRVDSFTAVYFRIGGGGSLAEGIDLLERALRVDPLNMLFRAILANSWMWQRRHDRALAEATKLIELDPPFYGAYSVIAQSYACLGRIRDAVDAAEKAYRAAPWHPRMIGWYAAALKLAGQTSRAEQLLLEMRRAENPLGVPMGMVVYHLMAGEPDDVLDWYERAVEQREPLAVAYTRDPNTARLQSNPRWTALLRTMGFSS
jgi:TolB-like protein/cytochrome c-type biogenesis protein CcmH/NrfG